MSITGTLIVQMIVFLILVGFTMKFIWPPVVKALDERAEKISHGLAAAENAKLELSNVHREVCLSIPSNSKSCLLKTVYAAFG